MEKTIAQIRKEKTDLAVDIANLITEFEEKTQIKVESISYRIKGSGGNSEKDFSLKIYLELL